MTALIYKMEIIKHLKIKNSLLNHTAYVNLKKNVVNKITDVIPELNKLRLNQELTTITCNIIENLYFKKNTCGIDKKILTIDILDELFRYDDHEKDIIEKQIQYAYDNNLIFRISFLKKWWANLKRFFSL
jgi:hypothetical protein